MAPYRQSGSDGHAEAPRDAGIVGEVIAQFADPLAFLRELVQNAIDAGTATVEIHFVWEASARALRVGVRDRGAGMTRDVLENQLLVLFRSTKELDATKIGKFGIGFASVLAPNPAVVVVETVAAAPAAGAPGERRRLVLHLSRDLTYRLFDAGPATQPGTLVELELPMQDHAAAAFVHRGIATLEHWCRHAKVPIRVRAEVPDLALADVRIDRPLALDGAVVEVRRQLDDDELTIVLGLTAPGRASVGFFNHGLTLYETTEPLLGPYACKIQDSRLGHTLSRDNVRRDVAFMHAVEAARELVPDLHAAIGHELRIAAESADLARYATLVDRMGAAGVRLPADQLGVPLVEPTMQGGEGEPRRWMRLADAGRVWTAAQSSALTQCLAAHGVPVMLDVDGLVPLVESYAIATRDVAEGLLLVTPVPATSGHARALLDALVSHLRAGGRTPTSVTLAAIGGGQGDAPAIAARPEDAVHARPATDAPYLVSRKRTERSPFARLRRTGLVLVDDHPLVRSALTASDPRVAASHLARALLLHYELLDRERSERLLDHTLALLGVEGAA